MHRTLDRKESLTSLFPAASIVMPREELSEQKDTLSVIHLESGETCPVTSWFDEYGCDCDPTEAEFAIVGPFTDGSWQTVELGQHSAYRMQ